MGKSLTIYMLLLSFIFNSCIFKDKTWQHVYRNESLVNSSCLGQLKGGNFILGGYYSVEKEGRHAYLLKFDSHGNKISDWKGPKNSEIKGLTVNKEGKILAVGEIYVNQKVRIPSYGTVESPIRSSYVVELSDNLEIIWEKKFPTTRENIAYDVDFTNDDGYIIIGETDQPNTDDEYELIKLDKNGNVLWQKEYGDDGDDEGYAVCQTRDGGYILTGRGAGIILTNYGCIFVVKVDSNGNIEWQKVIHDGHTCWANSVIQTKDNGYAIAGKNGPGMYEQSQNDYQAFILKLDSYGNKQWDREIGGIGYDDADRIIQTKRGDLVFAGQTRISNSIQGKSNILVCKLNSNGNLIWQKTYGGENDDESASIIQTKDGGFIISGNTKSYGAKINDIYIIKIDAEGNCVEFSQDGISTI